MGFVRYGKFKERHNIEVMVFRKRETGKLHRLLLLARQTLVLFALGTGFALF